MPVPQLQPRARLDYRIFETSEPFCFLFASTPIPTTIDICSFLRIAPRYKCRHRHQTFSKLSARAPRFPCPRLPPIRRNFLTRRGLLPILGAPRADGLRERCAAVAWVQNAVANKLDPDIGPRRWTRPYFRFMLLCNLPPATSSGGPPQSELVRLARVVAMYLPCRCGRRCLFCRRLHRY